VSVIIGNSTLVTLDFPNGQVTEGITSIEWNFGTNVNRLYTLGMGAGSCGPREFGSVRSAEVSVSFSIYGGITPETSTCPPAECANSPATVVVNIVPGTCDADVDGLSRAVFINSYSYSKDRVSFGTESWAGNAYVSPESVQTGTCNEYIEPEPTYVILGLAEGTIEGEGGDIQATVGARFRDDACVVETTRASVQASNISIGEYMIVQHGTFQSVGNSLFWDPGVVAKANVSLTLQPVYISS